MRRSHILKLARQDFIENLRYLPIAFDPKSVDFEMIGVVIGRLGAVE
jgi:hypothetical protein